MISTQDLSELPGIEDLRRLTRSLAVLDAILCAEWEYRYYSFDPAWAPEQSMASMRNGSGDDWFALFTPAGAGLIGLAHEATVYEYGKELPGLFDGLPAELSELRSEPAFDAPNSTFCVWRLAVDDRWRRGSLALPEGPRDPDGSAELLAILDGRPETYVAFATDYYERELDLAPVQAIYAAEPLTDALVGTLAGDEAIERVRGEARAMGYPLD